MRKSTYEGNEIVPVGFLNPDGNQILAADGTSTAFAADTVIRVTPTAGTTWIAIGTAPTATADTQGSHPIEQAQDFAIDKGDKINTTAALVITPFD